MIKKLYIIVMLSCVVFLGSCKKEEPPVPTKKVAVQQKNKVTSGYGFWATKMILSELFYGREYIRLHTFLARNAKDAQETARRNYYNSDEYNPTLTIKSIKTKFGVLYDPDNINHVKFANRINQIPDANCYPPNKGRITIIDN